MTSEIRTNSLKSRAGLSTVTLTDSGPMFSGITTFVDNSGFNIGTGSSIFSPATNTLTFGTNSNERLRITSAGKVGINSTSPSSTLDVVGGYQALGLYRNDFTGNSGAGVELYFGRAKADGSLFNCATVSAVGSDNTGQASQLRFSVLDSGSMSEKLRIDSTGQVSIGGNSSVGTKVHVENSSGDAHIRLRGSANCGVLYTRHSDGALIGYTGSGNAVNLGSSNLGISASLSGGQIIFQTGGTGASNERARIDSSGRFLIGETSVAGSTQKLVIGNGGNENFEFSPAMTSNDLNGGLIEYLHRNDGNTRPDLNLYTGGSGAIKFYTNGNQRFRITSGGCFFGDNIGIGTDNRWKIRPNSNNTQLAFEYSTSTSLSDTNIKMALLSDSVDVLSDFAIKSSLAKMSMIDTDGGDYFQLRNDGGTFKIRNSTDGRDDISITNNILTLGGVLIIADNNSIFFGSSQDIEFRHNATSSQNQLYSRNHDFLLQSYGTIYMQCYQSGNSTNGNVLTANYNSGTALYYQNGERIVTTNAGCKISNGLVMNGWLNISKNGTYAPASVGHTANNHEGIFWHSAVQYSIFRNSGTWGGPNYQQLNLNWPTGIHIDGGSLYGLSGARFNCHTMPYVDNNFDLGTSQRRWDNVYATNTSIISSSDETLKEEITSLNAAEMKAAKRLSGLFKKFKWKSAVAEKGSAARTHTGIIAQHVKTAMEAEGLDPTMYAFFCFDEWYENDKKEVITLDQLKDDIPDPLDSSKTLTPPSTEGYTKVGKYSIRYTELLSFIAAYNDQRFADLESRVASLQESITKVETLEQDNIALRARVTNLEGN